MKTEKRKEEDEEEEEAKVGGNREASQWQQALVLLRQFPGRQSLRALRCLVERLGFICL